MKNEEKFKTAEKRCHAYYEYTEKNGGVRFVEGFANWLALEAEDEKTEPCPFCGGMCVAYDKVVVCQNVKCDYRSGSYDNRYAAIAAHNRVARAVMANGKSEVNQ